MVTALIATGAGIAAGTTTGIVATKKIDDKVPEKVEAKLNKWSNENPSALDTEKEDKAAELCVKEKAATFVKSAVIGTAVGIVTANAVNAIINLITGSSDSDDDDDDEDDDE